MADIKKSIATKKASVKPSGSVNASTPKKPTVAKRTKPKEPTPSARSGRVNRPLTRSVTPEERYRLIEKEAYYRAEKRGFGGGHPAQDWLEAEAYIDKLLSKK